MLSAWIGFPHTIGSTNHHIVFIILELLIKVFKSFFCHKIVFEHSLWVVVGWAKSSIILKIWCINQRKNIVDIVGNMNSTRNHDSIWFFQGVVALILFLRVLKYWILNCIKYVFQGSLWFNHIFLGVIFSNVSENGLFSLLVRLIGHGTIEIILLSLVHWCLRFSLF